MANGSITFTPQQIDALVNEIRKHPDLGAQEVFCEKWGTAKEVLQMLQPILAAIPGVGLFAGPAIGVVIGAGDAAKKAVCPA